MRRDQLEHATRTARQAIDHPAVIVVGSQSILGSFDETKLPAEAAVPDLGETLTGSRPS